MLTATPRPRGGGNVDGMSANPTPPGSPTPAPSPAPPARTTAGRTLAVVAGGLLALLAIGLVVAGGAVLWANGQKDDAGYLSTGSDRFATGTYALATENLAVDGDVPGWVVDRDRYGKIRLQAASNAGRPVFVGVARTSDVSAYLRGSAHATVTDVDYSPFRASYSTHAGDRRPAPPAAQRFWAASATGGGAQELTWDVEHGDWSVVVMNADGSRGVDAGVSAGANVPVLPAIGWGTLGAGLLLLAAGGGLMYLGLRAPRPRRRTPESPDLTPAPAA
ncbi:MAG: hypothetical protein QOD55_1320 [Solirubrobacteraceae bacterium]|nr:hypothetical protein [Solirubrobacteraceae bacterium]